MEQRTLRPHEIRDAATLRPMHQTAAAPQADSRYINAEIDDWRIISPLVQREHSAIYYAQNADGEAAAIKIHSEEGEVSPLLRRVAWIHDPNLLPVLAQGKYEGHVYEVMPYVPGGTLAGGLLDEDVALRVVVPQLTRAMTVLHQKNMLHNDIKPSNLYWTKPGEEVALGDYDCLCALSGKQEDVGGTPEYMAPEVMNIGRRSPASDICSMGLTLVALVTGASPLQGKTSVQMRRAWMRGVEVGVKSPLLKVLISKMIDPDPDRRINAEGIFRWLKNNNIRFEDSGVVKSEPSRAKPETYVIWHGEEPIRQVGELVDYAGRDWDWGRHMLVQRQFGPFLRQFGLHEYELCVECEGMFDKDAALFTLLHSLARTQDFYWFGNHYDDLQSFVNATVDGNDEMIFGRGAHFLRTGMLKRYFINIRASQDKINRADELAKTAYSKPSLAISELMLSMSSSPEMKWKNRVFTSLGDVAEWIVSCEDDLDEAISELYSNQRFEAWLKYIGEANFYGEVKVLAEGY
ncbi:MAG: protein kinase [Clostridia bacterium]|nr:protein kinase [Clostridia bacterium]